MYSLGNINFVNYNSLWKLVRISLSIAFQKDYYIFIKLFNEFHHPLIQDLNQRFFSF